MRDLLSGAEDILFRISPGAYLEEAYLPAVLHYHGYMPLIPLRCTRLCGSAMQVLQINVNYTAHKIQVITLGHSFPSLLYVRKGGIL